MDSNICEQDLITALITNWSSDCPPLSTCSVTGFRHQGCWKRKDANPEGSRLKGLLKGHPVKLLWERFTAPKASTFLSSLLKMTPITSVPTASKGKVFLCSMLF